MNNISVSLSSHPMLLVEWHFSKSEGRESLPKQWIPYASKNYIRQEENPELKCGGRVSDQLISLHDS